MNTRRSLLLTLTSVIVTLVILWLTNRAVTPKMATLADVQLEAKNGGYRLITTDELAERYQGTGNRLLLVDTRQEWEYRTGHIKGAVNFPMEPTWWARWRKADALERFLGADKTRDIVFY